jgi:hypothetical protein
LEGITVQPKEDAHREDTMPVELDGLAALLGELMNPTPPPLLAHPSVPKPPQTEEQPRRSERLSNKMTAKLPTLEKAKVVLMKKLDILEDTSNAKEEHKRHLLAMF